MLDVQPAPSVDNTTMKVMVGSKELASTASVLSVTIDRDVNRIATATLVLYDGSAADQTFDLSSGDDLLPGQTLEIQAGYSSSEEPVFRGTIVRHEIRVQRRGESLLVLECKDAAYRLALERKCATFREVTDAEVMTQLIEGAGLTAQVEAAPVSHAELVQYQTSDWDFLLHRAERAGKVCVTEGDTVKVFAPTPAGAAVTELTFGNTVLDAELQVDARQQPAAVKAECWDLGEQALTVSETSDASAPATGNLDAGTLAADAGPATVLYQHGGHLTQPEMDAWVAGHMTKARFAKVRGTVKVQGRSDITPGSLVQLAGLGDRFSGVAFVSGVRHKLGEGDWLTTLQIGLDPAWHSQRVDVAPRPNCDFVPPIRGLHVGVVKALQEDPQGEFRVRVQVPVLEAEGDGIWARLASLFAGPERGSVFRPEIEDEVVVGFFDQDPRQPVVLGSLHSSAKAAPIEGSDDNFEKGIVTASGLKVTFNDEVSSLQLETPNGNKLLLTDENGGLELEDESGNKIVMSSDGITVESASDLNLKATGDLNLEGTNATVKANAGLTLEGSSEAKLSSSGTTDVKGSLVQIN